MSEHNYKFNVTMTCGGCSGAVERVLKRLDGKLSSCARWNPASGSDSRLLTLLLLGVKSYDVSLDTQTANVVTADNLDYTTVLNTIKKTGKKVNSGEADGAPQDV